MKISLSYKLNLICLLVAFLLPGIFGCLNAYGENAPQNSILIISSYNPETSQTSKNISAFLDEYRLLGGKSPVIIENMNCGSFTEASLWKGQMKKILNKYFLSNRHPGIIILLGQEAWSAFLSQDDETTKKAHNIPAIVGMVSRNAIILPDDSVSLEKWNPESIDALKNSYRIHKMAGYIYQYDVDKNIKLIQDLYPKTKHVALVTDNTYGGVSLQAYVKKEITKFPGLDLILLDGRKNSIYTIVDSINKLPDNTVMLLGTWRVDKNNGYFMNNATYMMMAAKPKMPAFTITSIGLGHWAVGGCVPQYRTIGKDMAIQAYNILDDRTMVKAKIELISNQYTFDAIKLDSLRISVNKLPDGYVLINEQASFYEQNKYLVWGCVFVFFTLLIGIIISLYFLIRTKKLKDELEVSEADLRVAKEKAEESERLKSAFLANMTHEIRTPLNAIVGFSNVLATGGCAQEDIVEYNKVIQTNSDLLLRLINDILDISRLESGKLDFYYEECNVESLCKEVLASVEATCKYPVEFAFESFNPNFYMVTDIQRLQQVLLNILSNSCKFTKEGSIILNYKIDEMKKMIFFSVTDTGEGIGEGEEEMIFDRFKKLNDFVQGSGLGLAICKTIMNVLGGDIWVDSSYKNGARFVFSHPLNLKPQEYIAE